MRYWIILILLLLPACKSYEGGFTQELAPKTFCLETGGEWRKIPRTTENHEQGIFDVDQHPDYVHQCMCETYWTTTGCATQ